MYCQQHQMRRSKKTRQSDAAYCRKEDWWKEPEETAFEQESHRSTRRSYYVHLKRKVWSIVLLKPETKQPRTEQLEDEFNRLVTQWNKETFHLSSLTKVYAHPTYQRIMAMG